MSYFDFTKEYGVVLEGGGAKGAYQVGALKAMQECGVKIKAVSGVSVGALNGALVMMGKQEEAVKIWENIKFSSIMKVNDEDMEKLLSGNINTIAQQGIKFIADGGADIEPLKKLIEDAVDMELIKKSDIDFTFGTFSIDTRKEVVIEAAKVETKEEMVDYLVASSHLPGFRGEHLGGKKYMDGGIVNNVPIDRLIERGCKDIIVIRIFGIGTEKKVKIPEDVNVTYFKPQEELGGIVEFVPDKIDRNIKLGYYDGLKELKNLSGSRYYIDCEMSEEECLRLFMINVHKNAEILAELMKIRTDYGNPARFCMEKGYPYLSGILKLHKDWTYKELYLAIYEQCALALGLERFEIYTAKSFIEETRRLLFEKKNEEPELQNIKMQPYMHSLFKIIEENIIM